MAESTGTDKTPVMDMQQLAEYRTMLRKELADLEFAQSLHPSDYKMERINRLRQRLDIPVEKASNNH